MSPAAEPPLRGTSPLTTGFALRLGVAAFLIAATVVTAQGDGGSGNGSLDLAPEPVLENFEPSVQEQLRSAREVVAGILATEGDPEKRGDALGQLAALYLLYDFMDTAEPLLLQARRLQPNDFRWPYFLALLYSFEGDPEAGLENARRSAELAPDHLASHLRRGDFAYELGLEDEARRAYERARELDDPSGAALYGLARLALDEGEAQAAVGMLEQALERQPPGSVIHYHLGVAHRALGDRERARAAFAANQNERVIFPDVLWDSLSTLNRSREAIFSRGVEALERGQPDLALETFGELIAKNPDDAEAHYNVGMSLLELGRKDEAEEAIRRAIELRDDYRDAYYNLGLVLGQRGDYGESEQQFRRVLEIDPEDLSNRVQLANALAEQGEIEDAVAMLDEVLEADPAMAEARLLLGVVHARRGAAEAAREQLHRILALAPGAVSERAEAHYHLAQIADREGDAEAAREELLRAAELEPEVLSLRQSLAAELGRRGELMAAAKLFESIVADRPEDPRAHLSRAMAYLLGGDEMAALTALERSLERHPEELVLRHLTARLLATAESEAVRDGPRAVEMALAVFEQQQTLDHGETVAMALAEAGRFAEAVSWQQRVLDFESREQGRASPGRVERMERYGSGQAVRAPWRARP
ncbi:MAG: tetratricopeptide repeat protein [Acidobacteria bacterium]|nr:MAG: tetratricopeptide repeat protein [Acidobacteriota bacterium]